MSVAVPCCRKDEPRTCSECAMVKLSTIVSLRAVDFWQQEQRSKIEGGQASCVGFAFALCCFLERV
jgi:hypothetical protein